MKAGNLATVSFLLVAAVSKNWDLQSFESCFSSYFLASYFDAIRIARFNYCQHFLVFFWESDQNILFENAGFNSGSSYD